MRGDPLILILIVAMALIYVTTYRVDERVVTIERIIERERIVERPAPGSSYRPPLGTYAVTSMMIPYGRP